MKENFNDLDESDELYNITDEIRVSFIQSMGNDATPARAARVSFENIKLGESPITQKDIKLNTTLATNDPPHWTPFGHIQVSLLIVAPIFVIRQIMRSTIGFVTSETSRRYVITPTIFFMPSIIRQHVKDIKQGSGGAMSDSDIEATHDDMRETYVFCHKKYRAMLARGVCREQARIVLPVGLYTSIWHTGSLQAYARLCNLRLDPHAQEETRAYAIAIDKILREKFPDVWNLLIKQNNYSPSKDNENDS